MIKLLLLLFGARALLGGKSQPSPGAPPKVPPEQPPDPGPFEGRQVLYADLFCGETAEMSPATDEFPGGIPLPPPPPSPQAEGMDLTAWKHRYPSGPPVPGTPAWPTVEGQNVPREARRSGVQDRWVVWRGCIDWQANTLNAALRADLSSRRAFADFDDQDAALTFGLLDSIAVDALFTLAADPPVPPIEPPWQGCPDGSRPTWDMAEKLAHYRSSVVGHVRPETFAVGSPAARRLRGLLYEVRVGGISPICSDWSAGELSPRRGSTLQGGC